MENIKNNKLCLLATFARSHENINKKNNNIHLSSSVCCVEQNKISLSSIINKNKKYLFIIRIVLNGINEIISNEINDSVVEITISLTYFLSLANNELKANEDFLYFIFNSEKLDSYISKEDRVKDWNSILNNCLFIFEDINWVALQLLFKIININISGGSNNRRQYLSSTDFNLSLFLIMLGFSGSEIYNSFNNLNKINDMQNNLEVTRDNLVNSFNNKNLILLFIYNILKDFCLDIDKDIESCNKNIIIIKNSIKSTEVKLTNIISKKKSKANLKNKNLDETLNNSKRISILNNQINKFNDNLIKIEKEIKTLEIQKNKINKESEKLANLPLIELKELYFNKFHNTLTSKKLYLLKKYLLDKTL